MLKQQNYSATPDACVLNHHNFAKKTMQLCCFILPTTANTTSTSTTKNTAFPA